MKQEILELIGYVSSVLILISLLMTSVVKFRVINGVGSLIFTVYAILIHSYPTAVLNACLVAVDVWFLVKVLRSKVSYSVSAVSMDESAVSRFLALYAEDISHFFPEWEKQLPSADRVFIVYDEMTIAGILAGKMEGQGELLALLDYSAPKYRDCSVGKYLYAALAQKGFQRLKTGTQVEKHARYLRKMGFTEVNGCFTLTLPHN
jgi:hypothetical protein